MCQSALRRHLQLTLHLLAPRQQTARQTWVGKSAAVLTLKHVSVARGCLSVFNQTTNTIHMSNDFSFFLSLFFFLVFVQKNFADKHRFYSCHHFWEVCGSVFADWKASFGIHEQKMLDGFKMGRWKTLPAVF